MKNAVESMDVIPQFNDVVTKTIDRLGKLDATLCSPRKGHRGTFDRLRSNKTILVTCYLLTWYSFSTASTFTNKVLIKKHHVSAEMLTLAHLSVCVICDLLVLTFPTGARGNSWRLQIISMRQFAFILPLSLLSVLSKVLTYWSYHAVPIAIAHTCKASQPLFNVMLAYFLSRSTFSTATYLTLVPIVSGVVMASVSEMGMNDLAVGGVMFAVTSAMLGVCQSMYAKYLLRSRTLQDSANMHFYSSCLSFAINAPLVLLKSSTLNNDSADKIPQSFPYLLVLGCSLMHFVNSFCASLVLSEVSELTFSIMGTMKRVVIILSAVLYFGNPVTFQSVTGMFLAVAGVGAYQLIKLQTKLDPSARYDQLPRTLQDISKASTHRK